MDTTTPRLTLNMTNVDAAIALSDGNAGAISVLVKILQDGNDIDRDGFFGTFTPLMCLDALQCYGSRIWMLYKDVCRESLVHMLAVLRGVDLGLVDEADLYAAISGDLGRVKAGEVLEAVKRELPGFGVEGED